MGAEQAGSLTDFEKDALHILPLSIVPLQSKALSRARLVKNARLQSMLEIFEGAGTGSGQIDPEMIEDAFDIAKDGELDDARTIRELARLNSFDVYSLRIQLRNLGIVVEDHDSLRLSEGKRAELTKYMVGFTRPLLHQIYGNDETDISDISELIALFDNPNREEALRNLRLITEKLHIELDELPRFLENYGDTFLSLAYFQDCHYALEPYFMSFAAAIGNMKDNHQMRQNTSLIKALDNTLDDLECIKETVEDLFSRFEHETRTMWQDINAETFNKVRTLIERNHTTIGAVLCGLSVKLGAWGARFGTRERGLMQQSEFILSEIRRGLDTLLDFAEPAPRGILHDTVEIVDL
jgi:hypothetical protein